MKTPLFLVKLFRYEYWSSWAFYLPLLPYFFYQAIKNKSFTFPVLANPSIEMGGLLGTSKFSILQKIRAEYLPKTFLADARKSFDILWKSILEQGFELPLIAKPDVGERGLNVMVIRSQSDLKSYLRNTKIDFLIQEFVEYPIEMGIFYSRLPNESKGKISSVTLKEFLTVLGDGKSTIETLMQQSTRARFQLNAIRKKVGDEAMNRILAKDEKLLLEPIGNHCRGTKFIDGRYLINPKLEQVFDDIAGNLEGIYYGRFDLKVPSLEDLYAGRNIKILELNGINSEPTHIYDPAYKLLNAYRDVLWHWGRITEITRIAKKRGAKPLRLNEAIKKTKAYFEYKKNAST